MRYLYGVYGICMVYTVLIRFLYGTYTVRMRYLYNACLALTARRTAELNGGQACLAFWQLCRHLRRAMKKESSGTIAKGLYVQMFGNVSNSVSGLSPRTFLFYKYINLFRYVYEALAESGRAVNLAEYRLISRKTKFELKRLLKAAVSFKSFSQNSLR